MRLYDYWRSSAAYRVRIALHLKGLKFEQVPVNLRQGGQRTLDYLARNAQGFVPTLEDGATGVRLTQSLAIVEWLDETHPKPPLLPDAVLARAEVRSLAQLIACDIHPINNLRVLQHLEHRFGLGERDRTAWYRHWIAEGFNALEKRLAATAGRFSHGDAVTLADLCLVPQVYNARRYQLDLGAYPTIRRVDAACNELAAFEAALPERQPDAS
jgi:maleylacetoacetate isomerase